MLKPSQVLYPDGKGIDDLFADVCWTTGIMRMHFPSSVITRLIETPASDFTDDDYAIASAITHEAIHLFQMANTGFAYDFSLRCLMCVADTVGRGLDLHTIYRDREKYSAPFYPIFESLEDPNDEGIRPIDLLEGGAYLCEKRIVHPELGPQAFEAMLEEEDDKYSRAYHVAIDVLGDDAFEHFHHVTMLALQTQQPHNAFRPLLELFRGASRTNDAWNHKRGVDLLTSSFADTLLGHPLELMKRGQRHPLLIPIVTEFRDFFSEHYADQHPSFLTHPYRVLGAGSQEADDIDANMAPAKILVEYGVRIFPPSSPDEPAPMMPPQAYYNIYDDPDQHLKRMMLIAAASALLTGGIASFPVPPPTARRRIAEQSRPQKIEFLECGAEERTPRTIRLIGERFDGIDADPVVARGNRGATMILFPDDKNPGNPYCDLSVRRFLCRLYDRIPHLLYYLADAPQAGSMLGCIAAHAADGEIIEMIDGTIRFDVYDGPTPLAVAESVSTAAEFARSLGEDPQEVFRGHLLELGPFQEILEEVLAALPYN